MKKNIAEARDMGYRFDMGPECKVFLFHTDENGQPTTISHEKAGYLASIMPKPKSGVNGFGMA